MTPTAVQPGSSRLLALPLMAFLSKLESLGFINRRFLFSHRQGDVINLGNRQLTVLHMPGHSRGSICLHDGENKLLFTGDVVYDGHMIDWLPYSHVSDYISSCERLVGLVDSEQVLVTQQGASSTSARFLGCVWPVVALQ